MKTKTFQIRFLFITLLVLAVLWIPQLTSAWPSDPTVNVPICTAANEQSNPQLVSDGAGGAIITWMDRRSDDGDIYAQRVDSNGAVLWTTDGVPICMAEGVQESPQLVSDKAGGAIITWSDSRGGNWDIYAQRVDASGAVLWTTDGVPVCTTAGDQWSPQIVSDNAGGAIITWWDWRNILYGIYVQRLDANGAVLWTTDGVPILTAANPPAPLQLVSDGASGAIITWQDNRSDYADIYAQRVFSDGSLPVTLSSFTATASDGKVTLTWRTETEVNNAGFDIYRSDAKDGKYVKVNARLVQGAGTDATPHDYSFTDENVAVGKTYYYYIEDVDFSGKTNRSHIIEVTVGKQSIKQEQIPLKFALLQNYPNPFNPETWLPYELAESVEVTLQIYDVSGKVVRSLRLGQKPAGVYVDKERAIYWDGRDEKGEQVSSGIYFYRLQAGSFTGVRKMVILK